MKTMVFELSDKELLQAIADYLGDRHPELQGRYLVIEVLFKHGGLTKVNVEKVKKAGDATS